LDGVALIVEAPAPRVVDATVWEDAALKLPSRFTVPPFMVSVAVARRRLLTLAAVLSSRRVPPTPIA